MENQIRKAILDNQIELFGAEIDQNLIQFQKTRKDVEGDFTLVLFPFVKVLSSQLYTLKLPQQRLLKSQRK